MPEKPEVIPCPNTHWEDDETGNKQANHHLQFAIKSSWAPCQTNVHLCQIYAQVHENTLSCKPDAQQISKPKKLQHTIKNTACEHKPA